ncbi:MAG: glycosyltransferase family 39 protein, partial [Chitinivibrionia bacterium]|nr:glycosyltransferase family 39 protein [Chitinivibrionia bacterium]
GGNVSNNTLRFFGGKRHIGYPFIRSISLEILSDNREKILESIDNLSVFIGNKCFYFSTSDLNNLYQKNSTKFSTSNYTLKLPDIQYAKTTQRFIKQEVVNYAGNDIFIVNSIFWMVKNPFDFALTYAFLIALFIAARKKLFTIINSISSQNKIIAALSIIIAFGLLVRLTGISQTSIWIDELYSLTRASNPQLPFAAVFGDPGNPPLYYVLLRLWMLLFGYTEISARIFSVICGTLAIITTYILLKTFSDKKTALFAALLTAFCGYHIGQSQEIRGYVLEIMLIPFTVAAFLKFVQNPYRVKYVILSSITSAMLANTHYYGAIFVFVQAIYFIVKTVKNKNTDLKNLIRNFLIFDAIVLLSFMPYFVSISIDKTVFDEQFNDWIRKPGLVFSLLALIFPLLAASFFRFRQNLRNFFSKNETELLNFIVFTIVIGYETVFAISLFRPILTERYLVIGLPLFICVISIFVSGLLREKRTSAFGILFGYTAFLYFLNTEYPLKRPLYKESFSYIKQDMQNHKSEFSIFTDVDIVDYNDFLQLINEKPFPIYDKNKECDIIYVPLKPYKNYYRFFAKNDFSTENMLIIRVNEDGIIYKKYKL